MTRVNVLGGHPNKSESNVSQLVDKAISSWCEQLAQYTANEPTVYPLELSAAHPTGLAQLLALRPTRLSSLVREPSALAHSRMRARELMNAVETVRKNHGVAPLFFSFGQVSFVDPDDPVLDDVLEAVEPAQTDSLADPSTKTADELEQKLEAELAKASARIKAIANPNSGRKLFEGPAFLIPATLSATDSGDVTISLAQSASLWAPLRRALVKVHGRREVERLERGVHGESGIKMAYSLGELRGLAQNSLVAFDVYEALTVGQYVHPSDLLVEDIEALRARISVSDMVLAIAGDSSALARIQRNLPEPNPQDRDTFTERGVGDLVPGHHDILEAVEAGFNLMLEAGDEGDVVQTVAALAVATAARGQSVAFISSDTAKTHGLLDLLKSLGLDDMVMDMTDPATWSETIEAALRRSCVVTQHAEENERNNDIRGELKNVRSKLEEYVTELHRKRRPWGISVFDALQVLADLSSSDGPRTRVRFSEDALNEISKDGAESAREAISAAYAEGITTVSTAENPWNGAVISGSEVVDTVIKTVQRISSNSLPRVRANISRVARETGLNQARTVADWMQQLDMIGEVEKSLRIFHPSIFERSAADMIIATAPRRWRRQHAYNMSWRHRRRLVKQAKGFVLKGAEVRNLHGELLKVQERRLIWRDNTDGAGWPVVPSGIEDMHRVANQLREDLNAVQPFLVTSHGDLMEMPVDRLARLVDALAGDEAGAHALPRRVAIMRVVRDLGIAKLLDDLRERRVAAELANAELDLAWWASALAVMLDASPILRQYDAQSMNQLIAQFRALDAAQVTMQPERVGCAYSRQTNELIANNPEQALELLAYLDSATSKSLASIVDNFPIARHLAPIRMAAAALVPQLYGERCVIDLAIIDLTCQPLTAEIIPVIARARQIVLISESGMRAHALVDTLSGVLPELSIPRRQTRHNELVAAFIAKYKDEKPLGLVASPRVTTELSLQIVDGRGTPGPGTAAIESSVVEVERVVEMVRIHAHNNPKLSLAVVALNPRHALRLREAIIAAAVEDEVLSDFYTRGGVESMLLTDIHNLAAVQRDVMILSVGYARTPHGRIIHDFGAISGPNGVHLLARALGVARGDIAIVSAIDPDDMEPDRLTTEGAQALRELLELARSGGERMSLIEAMYSQSEEHGEPDRLLIDLAERLYSLGLTVMPNVGPKDGLVIPLAIGHPLLNDELLVAVITDNATFAEEKSLRVRYRQWMEQLEESGWVVHMVHSASAFIDPQREAAMVVERVLDIVEERLPNVREKAEKAARYIREHGDDVDRVLIDTEFATQQFTQRSELTPGADAFMVPQVEQPGTAEIAVSEMPSNVDMELRESEDNAQETVKEATVVLRGIKPSIAVGMPLAAYSDDQLDEMLQWVKSDGRNCDDDELVEELRQALGITRRGAQVDSVLRNVVRRNGGI